MTRASNETRGSPNETRGSPNETRGSPCYPTTPWKPDARFGVRFGQIGVRRTPATSSPNPAVHPILAEPRGAHPRRSLHRR